MEKMRQQLMEWGKRTGNISSASLGRAPRPRTLYGSSQNVS